MTEPGQRLSALRADDMKAPQTGERTGSRPKPPKAGARSASLEPGRAPGYLPSTQLLPNFVGEAQEGSAMTARLFNRIAARPFLIDPRWVLEAAD